MAAIESVVEPRPPVRKIDLLVRSIGDRTRSFGEQIPFQPDAEWPRVFSRERAEFDLLVSAARDPLGLIEVGPQAGHAALTIKGWERLLQLQVDRPQSTKAFVAMWFNAALLPAWRDGFRRCLDDLGYDPVRVDQEEFLGKIDDRIVSSIRESALLVADVTGHRQGVYWEAGFAFGLGVPVLYTCRRDQIRRAHFDTRQYNHLVWATPADLAPRLRARIEATISNRPRARR